LKNVNEEVAEIATILVENFLGKESIDKLGVGATIDIFIILSQPSKWNYTLRTNYMNLLKEKLKDL
jgi:hypothetical protein